MAGVVQTQGKRATARPTVLKAVAKDEEEEEGKGGRWWEGRVWEREQPDQKKQKKHGVVTVKKNVFANIAATQAHK